MVWLRFDLEDWYKAEIDAGRPMGLHVDTDADFATDHMITAVGYEEVNGERYYGCHDTWDDRIHWYQWREISYQYAWGIQSGVMFNCFTNTKNNTCPNASQESQEVDEMPDIEVGPRNRAFQAFNKAACE